MLCQRSLHKPLQKPFKDQINLGHSALHSHNLKGEIRKRKKEKKEKPHHTQVKLANRILPFFLRHSKGKLLEKEIHSICLPPKRGGGLPVSFA